MGRSQPRAPVPLRRCRLLVLAALATALPAQETRIAFDRLSLEEGLSQSVVEQIVQDQKGFMWFATEDGLNRFDGYQFTAFKNIAGDPNSLSHNELESLHADSTGALWIGTFEGGLNRLDPTTGEITRYRHDAGDPDSLSHDTVQAIIEDRTGSLWLGTRGGGLDRFDPATGAFEHHRADPATPGSLSQDEVTALYEDTAGTLWVGTNGGGLNRRDPESGRFTHYRAIPGEPESLSDDHVMAIAEDRDGTLWIGTYGGGLDSFDRTTGRFTHFRRDPENSRSLGSNLVKSIREDHNGTLWIGTDGGGLNRLDRETGTFDRHLHDATDDRSLSTDRVFSVYQDRSRVLWVGTYGGGLNKFDVGRTNFRHYRNHPEDPNSLNHNIVWSIFEDRSGALWVGTDSGGVNRLDRRSGRWTHYRHQPDDPGSLGHDAVRVVFEDSKGRLWAGTHGGGLNLLDRATGTFRRFRHRPDDPHSLSNDQLRSISEDRSGAIWIGTFGSGLDRLEPETGRFTHYRHDPDDPASLSNDFIRTVVEDRKGSLWIGTQGGGLDRLDRESGQFEHFRHDPGDADSLGNDFVFAILEAADGTLWVGTYGAGLHRFEPKSGRFLRYTSEDGLASDSIFAILEDDRGGIWVSTTSGLSQFDPSSDSFRNFNVRDGLQSNEFNGGSGFRSPSGELFFGGINGFNSFFPEEIGFNPEIPEVAISDLRLFNQPVLAGQPLYNGRILLRRSIAYTDSIELTYSDNVFSLGFAALHFSSPEGNLYSYRLEGFSDTWIGVGAKRRFATFTGLDPGEYVFRVRAANSDGVWNEEGASLRITVTPPFWATWWFRLALLAAGLGIAAVAIRTRMRSVGMRAELQAAHDAQMGIMPQSDPEAEGFDISGICIPAHEVGGDFYDYFWIDAERRKLCIAVGDVAGTAMKAAMTAVMSDGMLIARASQADSIEAILTSLNRSLHRKVRDRVFTALCLVELDTSSAELTFANAGLCEPLHRTGDSASYLESSGPRTPLGTFPTTQYQSRTVGLRPGDVLLLFSDGIPEACNPAGEQYGYGAPRDLLAALDTREMSSAEIRDALIADVRRFSGGSHLGDDIVLVVVKALPVPSDG